MKIIGKFNSGEFFGDKCTIFFRVENAKEVHKQIYGMLTNGLFITFGEAVQFKGYLDGETSKKTGMTMIIVLIIEQGKMDRLFSFKGQITSIDIKRDPDSDISRSIANVAFITKLKGMMKTIGNHVGYTDSEIQKILIHGFAGECDITAFDLKRATDEELGMFKEYIIKEGLKVDIDLSDGIENGIPDLDDHLKMRRQMKKCCVCSSASVVVEGVYPLCNRHLIEFRKLRNLHPKVWEAKFRKKYLGE